MFLADILCQIIAYTRQFQYCLSIGIMWQNRHYIDGILPQLIKSVNLNWKINFQRGIFNFTSSSHFCNPRLHLPLVIHTTFFQSKMNYSSFILRLVNSVMLFINIICKYSHLQTVKTARLPMPKAVVIRALFHQLLLLSSTSLKRVFSPF